MSKRPVIVLCPHFAPDTAPTGVIYTRLVEELVAQGHRVQVVTALPWYREHRIEDGWRGRVWRTEKTEWGSITRVTPFPGKSKKNLLRRAAGFVGFTALVGLRGLFAGGLGKAHAVIAMSPPLTLGLTGRLIATARRAPLIFNVQDIFPDAAVATEKIKGKKLIAFAGWLERITYRLSDSVVVLADSMRKNVAAKTKHPERVLVIPNFVDTDLVVPMDRMTTYRYELGLGDGPVVMYAGNLGYSQSVELMIDVARQMPTVTFLINGEGSTRDELVTRAKGLGNVRFGAYQPQERLAEVLATGDVHIVPLRAGLGSVSVPSKTYSILAAARPVIASIDEGTEVARVVQDAQAGICVSPVDAAALKSAIEAMLAKSDLAKEMGARGRIWVEAHASPISVARAYSDLMKDLASE